MIYQFCITQECNLACRYCFEKEKNYKSYLSKEKLKEYCDFIIRDSKIRQEELIVNITGGEPLLHFDSVQFIIEYLSSRINLSIHFEISTNALLLSAEKISYLNKNNISLYIGFDGLEKSQNKNRKTITCKNSFRIVYYNLKKVFKEKNLQFENIVINMVVLPNNVKELYKNYLFLLKFSKYKNISINFVYEEKWTLRNLRILKINLRKVIKLYLKILIKKNIFFSLPLIDKQVLHIISNGKTLPSVNTCGAGLSLVSITTDGSILPCGDMIYSTNDLDKIAIGDIKNGINENLLNKFRCNIKYKLECCTECDFLYKCNFCPAINKRVLNNFNEIPYQVCEINKIVIIETESFIKKFYKYNSELFKKKYKI